MAGAVTYLWAPGKLGQRSQNIFENTIQLVGKQNIILFLLDLLQWLMNTLFRHFNLMMALEAKSGVT